MMFNPPMSIENILDRCITDIREHQRTVDECLTLYPEQRVELEPLLRLSLRLNAANTFQVPADFQRAALTRMNNLIAAHPRNGGQAGGKATPRGLEWRREFMDQKFSKFETYPKLRRLRFFSLALLSLIILVLLGSTILEVSARALPGEPLYRVKSGIESLRLALSDSDTGDASLRQDFARRRLDEAIILAEDSRTEAFTQALTDYTAKLGSTLEYIEGENQPPSEQHAAIAKRLIKELPVYEAELNDLLSRAPKDTHGLIQEALNVTRRGYALATMIIQRPPGPPEAQPSRPNSMSSPAWEKTKPAANPAAPSKDKPSAKKTLKPPIQEPGWTTHKPAQPSQAGPKAERTPKPANPPPGWSTHKPATRPGAWPTTWAPGLSNPRRPPHPWKTP